MLDDSAVEDSAEVAQDAVEDDHSAVEEVLDDVSSESEGGELVESDSAGDGEGDTITKEMRDFISGDSTLSLPLDSLTDELSEKIQVFSDSVESNYAKGKQQLADDRGSLDVKEKALHNLSTLNDTTLNTYSLGLRLKDEIDQLSQVNMTELWQSNPDQARQVSDALGRKQSEFQSVISTIGQQEQELSQAQQVEVERRREEGVGILNQKYKNFSTEQSPKLVKYAVSKGMSAQDANNWALNPIVAEMGYKAMQYDDMQKKIKGNPKPKKVILPVKSVKSKGRSSPGVKSPDKMSMDEYAKWRNSDKK